MKIMRLFCQPRMIIIFLMFNIGSCEWVESMSLRMLKIIFFLYLAFANVIESEEKIVWYLSVH